MDAYVRSREILETKIQIHKEMGQALLASRVYLTQTESVIEKESVRKRWEYVVLLLKKETEISEGKNVTLERQASITIPRYNKNLNFEYVKGEE